MNKELWKKIQKYAAGEGKTTAEEDRLFAISLLQTITGIDNLQTEDAVHLMRTLFYGLQGIGITPQQYASLCVNVAVQSGFSEKFDE